MALYSIFNCRAHCDGHINPCDYHHVKSLGNERVNQSPRNAIFTLTAGGGGEEAMMFAVVWDYGRFQQWGRQMIGSR